jgi:hypothetical protein
MRVQLLYFPGCPNVELARQALRRALEACRLPIDVEEVDVSAPHTPEPLRGWGSPTILIDGADVAGQAPGSGASCRLYSDGESIRAVPSEAIIQAALNGRHRRRWQWARPLAALPGVLLPLLPSAACPACLTAYAGALSVIGLGVLLTERVLAPLIAVFLAVNLLSLAWSTWSHRRPGPLLATLGGSVGVVTGRLVWSAPVVVYGGVALLITGALWNLWLRRPRTKPLIQLRPARKEATTP